MTCEQCTSSQELGADSLQISSLDIPLWLQSNGNHTPAKSSENDQPMDGFPSWLCGKEMSEISTLPSTPAEWIASMQVSLVKTLALLENKQVLVRKPDRGFIEKSCVLLAQLDHESSSWKMSPLLKATALSKLSKTWPSWGMTVDGCVYEHPMSGRRITEIVGSLWLTPRVVEIEESVENFRARMNRKRPNDRKNGYASLSMQVKAGFLPTPCARDWKDNGKSPAELQRNTKTLATHAGGKLNPTWVEWLMGWPIEYTVSKHLETVKSLSKSQSRSKSSAKG